MLKGVRKIMFNMAGKGVSVTLSKGLKCSALVIFPERKLIRVNKKMALNTNNFLLKKMIDDACLIIKKSNKKIVYVKNGGK